MEGNWWDAIYDTQNNDAELCSDLINDMDICSCRSEFKKDSDNTLKCINCGAVRILEGCYKDSGDQIITFSSQVKLCGTDASIYNSDICKSGQSSSNAERFRDKAIVDYLTKLYKAFQTEECINNTSKKLEITKNQLMTTAHIYSMLVLPLSEHTVEYNTYDLTDDSDIEIFSKYHTKMEQLIYTEKNRLILRSTNKKETLAAILYHVLLLDGITCPKSAIPTMFMLSQNGIAAGEAKMMKRSHIMKSYGIDLNLNRTEPEINTIFMSIQASYADITEELEEQFNLLKDAVREICYTVDINNIANRSIPNSKINGITYVVLRRCKNKILIPEVPNIVTFCSESIKKPTIIKVIEQIIEYHEEFVPIYEKYDLDTSVLELTDYIKKKA